MPTIELEDIGDHSRDREMEILALRATVRELRVQVAALEREVEWHRENQPETATNGHALVTGAEVVAASTRRKGGATDG